MDNGIKKGNPAIEKAELIAKQNTVEREIKTEMEQVDGVTVKNTTEIIADKQKVNDLKRQKRDAEKLLRDSLLLRLGVVPENYENFL